MTVKLNHRMECIFAIFGVIVMATLTFSAAFLTPKYDPCLNTISSLGYGRAKSLFSIGLVVGGCLGIPFFIYLERELVNIKEYIRRLATGASISTSVCIALCGIIPDETYHDIFLAFHGLVMIVAFFGSCIYISLYSYLMYQGPKSKLYSGPIFKKLLAYYGFSLNCILILFFVTFSPILEWILFILILIWVLITAIALLEFKFFNIAGIYFRRKNYPEALKLFQDSLEILNKLDLSEHPITKTIKENVNYLKSKVDKKREFEE
jgi:hypothetical protein